MQQSLKLSTQHCAQLLPLMLHWHQLKVHEKLLVKTIKAKEIKKIFKFLLIFDRICHWDAKNAFEFITKFTSVDKDALDLKWHFSSKPPIFLYQQAKNPQLSGNADHFSIVQNHTKWQICGHAKAEFLCFDAPVRFASCIWNQFLKNLATNFSVCWKYLHFVFSQFLD